MDFEDFKEGLKKNKKFKTKKKSELLKKMLK